MKTVKISAIENKVLKIPKVTKGKMSKKDIINLANKLAKVKPVKENYWKIVSLIGWGTKTTDFNAVRKALKLVPSYRNSFIEELESYSYHLKEKIQSKIFDKNEDDYFEAGDDGFEDMCFHMLGLGEKYWNSFYKDPKKYAPQLNDGNYAESFIYCFQPIDNEETEVLEGKTWIGIGIKKGATFVTNKLIGIIFKSDKTPTEKTHGKTFFSVVGPFSSNADAIAAGHKMNLKLYYDKDYKKIS